MSVDSASSEATATTAHCGGHLATAAANQEVSAASCVYGSEGESTAQAAPEPGTTTNTDACHTQRSLGRPGDGDDVTSLTN